MVCACRDVEMVRFAIPILVSAWWRRVGPLDEGECYMDGDRNGMIAGTDEGECIMGKGGNDSIKGMGGKGDIRGGEGNDTLDGGAGDDHIYGNAGNDELIGGTGNNTLDGGESNDTFGIFNDGDSDAPDTIEDFPRARTRPQPTRFISRGGQQGRLQDSSRSR